MRKNKLTKTRNILLSALAAVTLAGTSVLPALAADDTTTTNTTAGSFTNTYTLTLPANEDDAKYTSPAETFTFSSGTKDATSTTANTATLAAIKNTTFNPDINTVQELSSLDSRTRAAIKAAAVPTTVTLDTAAYPTTVDGVTTGATTAGNAVAVNVTTTGTYKNPGVYYYDFHEVSGTTAGITYSENNYRVALNVENDNGTFKISSVKLINKNSGNKVDSITNTYGAGKLSFTKKVSGNAGDTTTKTFTVTVTLTSDKTVKSTIGVTGTNAPDANELKNIDPGENGWTGTKNLTYTVVDGTTITLTNIPAGVSWLVKEADYSKDGYDTTYSLATGGTASPSDLTKTIPMVAGQDNAVTITNKRDTVIDTGIFTSNAPYFMILGIAVIGGIVYFAANKKRHA